MVLGGEFAEGGFERVDVIGAVVWGQGDAGQQDLDVRVLERGEDRIEIAAGHVGGEAPQTVVASKLDDDDGWVKREDVGQAGHGVLRGGAAGALVVELPLVTGAVEFALKGIAVGLAGLQAVPGGDAVAKADEDWAGRGERQRGFEEKERNDKQAANVHMDSVSGVGNRLLGSRGWEANG